MGVWLFLLWSPDTEGQITMKQLKYICHYYYCPFAGSFVVGLEQWWNNPVVQELYSASVRKSVTSPTIWVLKSVLVMVHHHLNMYNVTVFRLVSLPAQFFLNQFQVLVLFCHAFYLKYSTVLYLKPYEVQKDRVQATFHPHRKIY